MKDIVVLFYYDKLFPMTVGGDESSLAVGIDCSDGSAYNLMFYDRDDHPSFAGIVRDVYVPTAISYDIVRKYARVACQNGFLKDSAQFDGLNASTWKAYIQQLPKNRDHIIIDEAP